MQDVLNPKTDKNPEEYCNIISCRKTKNVNFDRMKNAARFIADFVRAFFRGWFCANRNMYLYL